MFLLKDDEVHTHAHLLYSQGLEEKKKKNSFFIHGEYTTQL